MGRYYYDKKDTAEDLHKIQIWWLKKYGYLKPGLWYSSGGITWTRGWSETKSSVSFATCTSNEDGKQPSIRFMYTQTSRQTDEKEDFDYPVSLVSTPCRFGGVRWWFICPLVRNGIPCNRRVGVLYLGGKYFGCRHCYNLSYESRNENRRFRLNPLFSYMRLEKKEEELRSTIKRHTYAGKPTRKQRRLSKLRMMQIYDLPNLEEIIYNK